MEESFAGRRVTVMGLGIFGAGVAVVRFFAQHGADILVTDLRDEPALAESVSVIADLPSVRLRLGRHRESDFTDADLVVASPAVPPDNPYLALARHAGIPITTEIRLFWQRCDAPIVGVTGSNGKSTTATLIRDILQADGRKVWLGGNIGRSLLPHIGEIQKDHWVVLELSSFQLADLNIQQLSPHVAVITNFTPNHLDWHGTLQEYANAKQTVLRWQTPDDIAVRHRLGPEAGWPTLARSVFCGWEDDPQAFVTMDVHHESLMITRGGRALDLADCSGLPTRHQRYAAMLAATAGSALGISSETIATALKSFSGLPHRLQLVREMSGRRIINDSASTTPESTIAALTSLGGPAVLIVGGSEKGCELTKLAAAICCHARVAIVIGDVRQTLVPEISRCRSSMQDHTQPCLIESLETADTLAAAVEMAGIQSRPGDTILFSPGFSSGSMFANFSRRGDLFTELVHGLP